MSARAPGERPKEGETIQEHDLEHRRERRDRQAGDQDMSVNTDQTAELESLPLAFSDEDLGDGQILLACPVCGHDYNHHGAAASFTRDGGEDGPSQITTTAPISQIALRDNPSSRRHAIRVAMSGECGHTWYLDIIQHKGQTFLGAVTTPSERSHPAFSDAQTDRT